MSHIFDLAPIDFHAPSEFTVSRHTHSGVLPWCGAHIAYDLELPSGGPEAVGRLLLLVNGYQRTRLDFRAFRKRLAALRTDVATLALDNRGVGETTWEGQPPAELALARMAMDAGGLARRAAESLGLSSFTTLGISMGGMIAQVVAARCPGVDGLVLVSTTAGGSGRVWPDHGEAPERLSFREWPTDEAGMRRKMSRYFGRRFLEKSPLLVEMMVKNMLKTHCREPGTEEPAVGVPSLASVGSRLQFHASAGFDGTSLLTDLHMPVLVVTGDEDVIIPKENAYFLHSRVAGSRLVEYAGAGHLLLVEEPDAFVNDVAGFLG